jgi:formyltetrahydrofolate-dependent phosphoribosylglycinamide formyltransferase
MFQRLQQKWKVSGTQFFLILCVFAITGTTTAYLTRQVTYWLQLEPSSVWYWLLKVFILIFGYQILILLFAVPFGQFNFFWKYEKKILQRMKIIKEQKELGAGSRKPGAVNQQPGDMNLPENNPDSYRENTEPTTRLAVFASGAGSNAQKIIDHFRTHSTIKVALIVCNKPGAGVLSIAEREQIPSLLIEKEQFFRGNGYVDELKAYHIDFIVLAGFLWKIPTRLIAAYPLRMINIHPALLPGYGGKGMYGRFVHEAVIAAKDAESGISIHYVDEIYDHGGLIFQSRCTIEPHDTPDSLAQKIHALEHAHYPLIIEKVVKELQNRR